MKRLIIILFLLCAGMSAYSQNMFVCTRNIVNVRKGPGKNYSIIYIQRLLSERQDFWQIPENGIVRYLGKKKNGYMYVEAECPVEGSMGYKIEKGWVYAGYFKPLTSKCSACNGKGFFERPCELLEGDDHPMICVCWHEILTPDGIVELAGRQICEECRGYGYIK